MVYTQGPLDTGGIQRLGLRSPRTTVEAPLSLPPDEPLRLRVFLDKPMLEVFANDRQCLTQQVFPSRKDSLSVKVYARGGQAMVPQARGVGHGTGSVHEQEARRLSWT